MEVWKKVLLAGVEAGEHLGGQICVRQKGKTVIDFSCGELKPGVPLRQDTIMPWFSSGKPLTALCIAQLHEQGELHLEDEVALFIPEFGQNGKENITLLHLLTHTAGIRAADKLPPEHSWADTIREIAETPLEPGWEPGKKAGYSTNAAWFILGEIIQRITGRRFSDYMREQLLEPLGMNSAYLEVPPETREPVANRLGLMFDTAGGKMEEAPNQDPDALARCRPGSSARGPASELVNVYSMLLRGGEWNGRQLLRAQTVELFTRRHRVELHDHTFLHKLDWGLGFILNSNHYGVETVPYGYGRHASERAFGHSGAQSSCAFADPEHDLAVAWVVNGMPGERPHQKRQRELNSAIYRDLGLA